MRRAPLLLAGLGGLAAFLAADTDTPLTLARLIVCGATLGAAAAFDVRERRIPNRLVLPAAGVCAILSLTNPGTRSAGGVIAGLGVVGLLLLASLTQPHALGMGDVKLALVVVLGLENGGLQAIAYGVVLAALAGLAILARDGSTARQRALPMAPFLALGSLAALLA